MIQKSAFPAATFLLLLLAGAQSHQTPSVQIPGAVPLTIGTPIRIDGGVQSAPVIVDDRETSIVRIGQGTFSIDDESHLTARFSAGVSHCAEIRYWIHAAVFDVSGELLGTASREVSVSNVRLPVSPCIIQELELDFGISKRFTDTSQLVVTIGKR